MNKNLKSLLFYSKTQGGGVLNTNIGYNSCIEEIKAMADKLMYADKDEYYRRTRKDRRRVWFINGKFIYTGYNCSDGEIYGVKNQQKVSRIVLKSNFNMACW